MRRGRTYRWIGISVLLAFAFLGTARSWFTVCEDSVADDASVVEVCRTPNATDLPVVVGAAIIVLLLWPEISELGVPGLLSVKRKAEEAETKADAVQQAQTQLENRFMSFQSRIDNIAAASATASSGHVIMLGTDRLQELQDALPHKAAVYRSEDPVRPPERRVNGERVDYNEEAVLGQRLIAKWEELSEAVGLGPRRTVTAELSHDAQESRDRFLAVFGDELEIVRAARNSVAHARPLSAREISQAIEIAERLLDYANGP